MIAVSIQRLSAADIGLARAMNALFAKAFEEPAHYADAPPDDAWLAEILSRESVVALVALTGERVVAAAVAYELDKLEQRRRGIATALIDTLRHHAAARGCSTPFVQAVDGDDQAIALYTKLGKRDDVVHFDITPAGVGGIGPSD